VDNTGKDLVVQFSVKHAQKLDCGGGYIKLLPTSRCAARALRRPPAPARCSRRTRAGPCMLRAPVPPDLLPSRWPSQDEAVAGFRLSSVTVRGCARARAARTR